MSTSSLEEHLRAQRAEPETKLFLVRVEGPVPYDSYDSMVVRATDKSEAVRVSNEHGWGDLGSVSPDCVSIQEITVAGPAEVVHDSFNAG